MIDLRVQGIELVLSALTDMDKRGARTALRQGVTDATRPLLWAMRSNLKATGAVDTKALYRSLGRKTVALKNGTGFVGKVGPRADAGGKPARHRKARRQRGYKKLRMVDPVNYAHLVEYGTRPHSVARGAELGRKRKRGASPDVGQDNARQHPGARAKPFMRPARDANEAAVRRAIEARLSAALLKAAGRR